jgi:hypothetical protein
MLILLLYCLRAETFDSSSTEFTYNFAPGQYKIELWEASGGTVSNAATGGKGGYVSVIFSPITTQSGFFYIGKMDGTKGGGAGGTGPRPDANGGGVTYMMIGSTASSFRILVAGGGGGGGGDGNVASTAYSGGSGGNSATAGGTGGSLLFPGSGGNPGTVTTGGSGGSGGTCSGIYAVMSYTVYATGGGGGE